MLLFIILFVDLIVFSQCSLTDGDLTISGPKVATIGEEFSLQCKANKTMDYVRWKRQGENIATVSLPDCKEAYGNRSGYKCSCFENEYLLTVPRISVTNGLHKTVWNCGSLNGPLSNNYTLHIQVPVSGVVDFIDQPQIIYAHDNQEIEILCTTNPCRPAANIKWVMGGKDIVSYSNQEYQNVTSDMYITESTLLLRTFKNHHGATITCLANNTRDYGFVSLRSFQLDVKYGPGASVTLTPDEDKFNILENDNTVVVTCFADCNPPCNVTWWRNHQQISENQLTLSNMSRNDSGDYLCKAFNKFDDMFHIGYKGLHINVLYLTPAVELVVYPDKLIETTNVTVECTFDGHPFPDVVWSKSGRHLKTEKRVLKSRYVIKDARCIDTGNYTCAADNGIGINIFKTTSLLIKCKPTLDSRFPHKPNQTIYVPIGSSFNIWVHILAYPLPMAIWRFRSIQSIEDNPSSVVNDNVILFKENMVSVHKYRLLIPAFSQSNEGEYTLYVKNEVGDYALMFRLKKKVKSENNQTTVKYMIPGLFAGLISLVLIVSVMVILRLRKKSRSQERSEYAVENENEITYQNSGRILELESRNPYENLDEDDPSYLFRYTSTRDSVKLHTDDIDTEYSESSSLVTTSNECEEFGSSEMDQTNDYDDGYLQAQSKVERLSTGNLQTGNTDIKQDGVQDQEQTNSRRLSSTSTLEGMEEISTNELKKDMEVIETTSETNSNDCGYDDIDESTYSSKDVNTVETAAPNA